MKLSRDKYVANTEVYVEKLVRKVMEDMDFDTMWQSAYNGLTNHYIDNDQCFVEDYYETFPEEDPERNGVQEKEEVNKIIYFHGHHSNPCVVGEICIPGDRGSEVIVITHNMIYEDYGDNLCDVTKVWDANVQVELLGFDRYDTDYDTCIHIPLNLGEHTALTNQVLKQILLNNNIELVSFGSKDDLISTRNFLENYLGV